MTKDKYCVFGNPIAHSKSPAIHHIFAKQTGEAIVYEKQCIELGKFKQSADAFFQSGGKGLNVTVPFKVDAYDYADVHSERATLAGAVNTLMRLDDSRIFGDNTDGAGLVSNIVDQLQWRIKDKRILVLGAGGAVRGVLLPLLQQQPARLLVSNRTEVKAQALVELFKPYGAISACGFDALLKHGEFDIIINATSAGLSHQVPTIPTTCLSQSSCVYDMVYSNQPTDFMRWAKTHGVTRMADGIGMLIGQAAESFRLWRGIKPDTALALDLLNNT